MIKSRVVKENVELEYTLYGPIRHYNDYKELIEGLETAADGDVITIKIASPGGRVDVGTVIVKAIKESAAMVVARIVYPSASMAAIIACACDGLVIDKHSYLMFHTYSSGTYGKSDEIIQNVVEYYEAIKGFMNEIIYPFVSKPELRKMYDGKDIYVRWNCPTLTARLKRHYPHMHIVEVDDIPQSTLEQGDEQNE